MYFLAFLMLVKLGHFQLKENQEYTSFEAALQYSQETSGAEAPLALIVQEEYIAEPEPGKYVHKKESRVAEWQMEWLRRPKRDKDTIPKFFASNAPENRLDILRGLA